ncbi:GntR family transcriptional regulator [Paenibacillus sp. 1_12]|uniref:GntR family transcriptional regulator n=1 Tax=Paenibacillus sp. 1_12 TaxID=1566278 RepID=UPI0008F1C163|nr:GntR family transcriptional regulator [Paenibacillus sp. 1_12]SFM18272.1 GntR family transcriptional regulator [Paenibacillus sp. 1_12]
MKHNYLRIKEELERQMRTGELAVGDKLPSEPDMARKFKVSRETFRSAVKQLEQEGKLKVRSGFGRYVVRPLASIPSSIDHLSSTSEMINSSSLQEGERHESIRIEPCQEEWAKFLEINPEEPVTIIERIRMADGEPVSFNINIMPNARVGQLFHNKSLQGSLMQFLETECGIRIVSANTELIVPPPSDMNSRRLLVKPEATVILLKQTHYTESQVPILFSYDYFRNDVFKFWVRRTR